MSGKKGNGIKVIAAVLVAAIISAGSYYMGYTNHASSVISAIPKQAATNTVDDEPKAGAASNDTAPESDVEHQDESADAGKYIGKSASSAAEATWSVIDSYESDINSDGIEEKITLYTSAETNSGEVLWNDSQKWVLEVQSGESYYILLNQNISNGRVYFDVDEMTEGTYTITVYILTTAGKSIKQYTYSKTGFVEKQIYSSSSINNLHTGMPAYK